MSRTRCKKRTTHENKEHVQAVLPVFHHVRIKLEGFVVVDFPQSRRRSGLGVRNVFCVLLRVIPWIVALRSRSVYGTLEASETDLELAKTTTSDQICCAWCVTSWEQVGPEAGSIAIAHLRRWTRLVVHQSTKWTVALVSGVDPPFPAAKQASETSLSLGRDGAEATSHFSLRRRSSARSIGRVSFRRSCTRPQSGGEVPRSR